jgi:hypothetical protein
MALVSNLDGVRHAYTLCFVRTPWAFFTLQPLDRQWGDGWERAPYERHAGPPYDDAAQQITERHTVSARWVPPRSVARRLTDWRPALPPEATYRADPDNRRAEGNGRSRSHQPT